MKSALPNIFNKRSGWAISYARFSSVAQAEGDSLNRQSSLFESYCKNNNLEAWEGGQYFDKGISAFTGKNKTEGQLAALLQHAESGHFPPGTKLIVESFDRLGRDNVRDQFLFFSRLLKAGLTIVTFDGGFPREYLPERDNDIGDLLMVLMPMLRANEESRLKGERVRKGWDAKRKKASELPLTKIAPYWLELKDNKFLLIKERAEVVREIFQLSKAGHGKRSIAKILNERREPVWSTIKRNPLRIWRESYIEKILTNVAVLGDFQPHVKIKGKRIPEGDLIKGYFPAVVTEEEFFSANSRRQQRKGKAGRSVNQATNLFAGLAKCMCCGGPMYYRNKGNNWVYLACEMRALKHGDCKSMPVAYKIAEKSALEALIKVDWVSVLDPARKVVALDFAAMWHGKLAETNRRLGILLGALEDGDIQPTNYRERVKVLQAEKESYEMKLREGAKSEEERAVLGRLSSEAVSFMEGIESGNLTQSQRLDLKTNISQLIDAVYIRRDEAGDLHFVIIFINGGVSVARLKSNRKEIGELQVHCEVSDSAGSAYSLIHHELLSGILGENVAKEFAIMRRNTRNGGKSLALGVYTD